MTGHVRAKGVESGPWTWSEAVFLSVLPRVQAMVRAGVDSNTLIIFIELWAA